MGLGNIISQAFYPNNTQPNLTGCVLLVRSTSQLCRNDDIQNLHKTVSSLSANIKMISYLVSISISWTCKEINHRRYIITSNKPLALIFVTLVLNSKNSFHIAKQWLRISLHVWNLCHTLWWKFCSLSCTTRDSSIALRQQAWTWVNICCNQLIPRTLLCNSSRKFVLHKSPILLFVDNFESHV